MTLYNVCAVHRGVQYSGGCSVCAVQQGLLGTLGGYREYTRGDIMINVGKVIGTTIEFVWNPVYS